MTAEPTITIKKTDDGYFGTFVWVTSNGLHGWCEQTLEDLNEDATCLNLLRSRLEDFAESQGFDLNKVKREGVQ